MTHEGWVRMYDDDTTLLTDDDYPPFDDDNYDIPDQFSDEPEWETVVLDNKEASKGFSMMPYVLLGRSDISPNAKVVYLGLLKYAWQRGSCFPGQSKLATAVGLSERSVRRGLRELEGIGWLKTRRRGLNRSNQYVVHFPG